MQSLREQLSGIDRSLSGFKSSFPALENHLNADKKLKVREFISWSVCSGAVSALTGLLLFLKIGITMESVTTGLFTLSLAGLAYFVVRIFFLTKSKADSKTHLQVPAVHELN